MHLLFFYLIWISCLVNNGLIVLSKSVTITNSNIESVTVVKQVISPLFDPCQRGFGGINCLQSIGCTGPLGCDNGGICVTLSNERLQDSYCSNCFTGIDLFVPALNTSVNATTHYVPGFRGTFCEISNADGASFTRVRVLTQLLDDKVGPSIVRNKTVHRNLLGVAIEPDITVYTYQSSPSYRRACDCGVDWSIQAPFSTTYEAITILTAQMIAADEQVPQLMLTGNYDRSTSIRTEALLATVGFDPADRKHYGVLTRTVGSHEQAHYQCFVDFFCDGYYAYASIDTIGQTDTNMFQANTFQVAYYSLQDEQTGPSFISSISMLPDAKVTVFTIDRMAQRPHCDDSTLDHAYYAKRYASGIRANVSGITLGNIDIPTSTSPTVQAEFHWRLFGHINQLRPNIACDMTLTWDQDVAYCNSTLRIQPFIPSDENIYVKEEDIITTTTLLVCAVDRSNLSNDSNNSIIPIIEMNTTSVVITHYTLEYDIITTGALLLNTTIGNTTLLYSTNKPSTCSLGTSSELIQTETFFGNKMIASDLHKTCAPIGLTDVSAWINQTRPINGDTGFKTYYGVVPLCSCILPFRSSQQGAPNDNKTDCADSLCADGHGAVNTTWFFDADINTIATREACICDSGWMTTGCSGSRLCNWCQQSTCHPEHGGINIANGSIPCLCPTIFSGLYCETSRCIENGTYPFNYTFSDGRIDSNSGLQLERVNAICQCRPGYYGTFCERHCVYGDFDPLLQTCICNHRQGYRGTSCDEPICDSIHGAWELRNEYILGSFTSIDSITFDSNLYDNTINGTIHGTNNTTGTSLDSSLTDTQVGHCKCESYIFTQPECRSTTCDTNSLSDLDGWNGFRPFGVPQKSGLDGTWSCDCNFPYAAIVGHHGASMDCKANMCGYGTPNAYANASTSASDMCTCEASENSIGIYTPPSLCTERNAIACPRPCAYGHCHIDVASFGPQPLGGPPKDPCCFCTASVGYHIISNTTRWPDGCSAACTFTQPCLNTDTSSIHFDKPTNTYVCSCNPYYTSINDADNDCSIYTPPLPTHTLVVPSKLPLWAFALIFLALACTFVGITYALLLYYPSPTLSRKIPMSRLPLLTSTTR